jgi:hypothetical protein
MAERTAERAARIDRDDRGVAEPDRLDQVAPAAVRARDPRAAVRPAVAAVALRLLRLEGRDRDPG